MKSVGLAMIVKNGADVLDVCLHSAQGLFDQTVVVDTGSTDNSIEVAKRFGAEVYSFEWKDDFAAARNFSFSKLKTDWGFWLDDDDLLFGQENFRYMLQRAEEMNVDAICLEYFYSFDAVGQKMLADIEPQILARQIPSHDLSEKLRPRCSTTQYRERLIKLDPTWQWRYPIHEALPAVGRLMGKFDLVKVIHRRHVRKNQAKGDRNLRILEAVPLQGRDERIWFYLGLEYAHHGRLDDSIEAFGRFLPISTIEDEKYQAYCFRGDLFRAKDDLAKAEQEYLAAIALRPQWRSAYAGLLNVAVRQRRWMQAAFWASHIKDAVVPDTPFAYSPVHEGIGWVSDYAQALAESGQFEQARKSVEDALKIVPESVPLGKLFEALSTTMNNSHASEALGDVIEYFLRNDDAETAALIIARLPAHVRKQSRISEYVKMTGAAMRTANRGELPVGVADPVVTDRGPWELVWQPDRRVQMLGECLAVSPDVRSLLMVGGPENSVEQLAILGRQGTLAKNISDITGQYDGVVLWSVLEKVKFPADLIDRCRRALNPGGWLYAWVPNGAATKGLAPPTVERVRMRSFTADGLRQVLGTVRYPFPIESSAIGDAGELFLALPTELPPGRARTIAIVCPGAPEPWGWQSLGEGIGGSEEAVVRLSRAFAMRGHSVTVYGSGRYEPHDGPWGRIGYLPLSQYSRADVLIAWRHPEIYVGQLRPFEAGWRALWLHDSIAKERVEAAVPYVDLIWTISDYHASLYAGLPKVYRGRNGIDPWEFDDGDVVRNPAKLVYVSTPFRGLDILLENHWPEIKRRVPEAELHAYYGWESADRMGTTSTPDGKAFKEKITALCEQPGVVWHGRVGQPELYREVRSAGVWAYPTRWKEEHCISAYVAQAAGAWPVVFPLGALPQSVVFGWKTEPENFTDSVIEAIHTNDGREAMAEWTRKWTTWDEVASLWERCWRGLSA